MKTCNNLFQTDKNPTDDSMREALYTALTNDHPEEIEKIESTKDGWYKYWTEVLQSLVTILFIYMIIYIKNYDANNFIIGTNKHTGSL